MVIREATQPEKSDESQSNAALKEKRFGPKLGHHHIVHYSFCFFSLSWGVIHFFLWGKHVFLLWVSIYIGISLLSVMIYDGVA